MFGIILSILLLYSMLIICLESYVIIYMWKTGFLSDAFLIRSLTPDLLEFSLPLFSSAVSFKNLSASQTFSEILFSQDSCLFCALSYKFLLLRFFTLSSICLFLWYLFNMSCQRSHHLLFIRFPYLLRNNYPFFSLIKGLSCGELLCITTLILRRSYM